MIYVFTGAAAALGVLPLVRIAQARQQYCSYPKRVTDEQHFEDVGAENEALMEGDGEPL